MARNRRNSDSDAARLTPALLALLICACFVSAGVGYVWYKNQTALLSREITKLEDQLKNLQTENKLRRDSLAEKSLPVNLIKLVEEKNLGLGPPALSQIVRINEAPVTHSSVSNREHSNAVPRLRKANDR